MKILFLLLHMPEDLMSSNMYTDLIQEFNKNGHNITVIAPSNNKKQYVNYENGVKIVRVKSMATQDVNNLIKKGIALALLPFFYKRAYNKYLANEQFDWIFMPTPPITLIDFVSHLKKKINAKFYLILRDIHPQSVASIGLIKNDFFYNYLEKRASKGYKIADIIGCMSPQNIEFIKKNYNLNEHKLTLLYNWLSPSDEYSKDSIEDIRSKYNLNNKVIALFGGNIGFGQKIENILNLANRFKDNQDLVFLVIGKGVKKIELLEKSKQLGLSNILFMDYMPKNEYLKLVSSVDIGLISINEKYSVPTCPSKAISYMQIGIPIFAMINPKNDYGLIIERDAGAGYYTIGSENQSGIEKFEEMVSSPSLRKKMGSSGLEFYKKHLTTKKAYDTIIKNIHDVKS
jgi:glycosyltransferase involved in cell wall biosynthesis